MISLLFEQSRAMQEFDARRGPALRKKFIQIYEFVLPSGAATCLRWRLNALQERGTYLLQDPMKASETPCSSQSALKIIVIRSGSPCRELLKIPVGQFVGKGTDPPKLHN